MHLNLHGSNCRARPSGWDPAPPVFLRNTIRLIATEFCRWARSEERLQAFIHVKSPLALYRRSLSASASLQLLEGGGLTGWCWPWWGGAGRPGPDSEPPGSAGWAPWGGRWPETGPCWAPPPPSSRSDPESGDGSRCAGGSGRRCPTRCRRCRWATKIWWWREEKGRMLTAEDQEGSEGNVWTFLLISSTVKCKWTKTAKMCHETEQREASTIHE